MDGSRAGRTSARLSALAMGVALVLAACTPDATQPGDDPGLGVDFGVAAGTPGAHKAQGDPASTGDILGSEFAVALPDSVGGLVVVSYDAESSDLFILQVQAVTAGTYACAPVTEGPPCHGRFLENVRTEGDQLLVDGQLDVIEGSIDLLTVGPDRLTATFQARLERSFGDGEPVEIVVQDGTIDVPWVAQGLTDGRLTCLIGLTGATPGCTG